MKRPGFAALVVAALTALCPAPSIAAGTPGKEAFFLSNPCLSPDGSSVVFSFEGDLWRASVKGGQAARLTAMPGYETSPRWSPDGKWIAFTGRQNGNADLFIMPAEGGDIKQLTWHSGSDELNSWSWDSKSLYFTSSRAGQQSGFKVAITGGTPVRVFGNYFFQYDHNLVEHPTSGEIFFNDTWESSNQLQRKHYKGPFNPDIESYNPGTKQFKRYTDYPGKDFGATLDRKGNIYFLSDEGNGEYNLYTFRDGKKTALTNFPNGIRNAQVSADGGTVVFEKDYQLYLYDVKTATSSRLDIGITRDYLLPQEKDFEVKENISNFDVSPDGKKLAFTSRGELFVSDIEGKFIQQIEKGSAERADEVHWLSDNKTLLFNQTAGGYLNWYTIGAYQGAGPKAVTTDVRGNRSLHFNKDRSKAIYLSGRDELRMLDCKTLQNKTIVKDEFWALQSSDPGWSPDGSYVVYTAHRNFEEDIFVYNVNTGKSVDLTNTGVAEGDPIWSPDGKYIYFTSSRLKPSYPFGMQNPKVYRLPLQKFDEPFRSDKFGELFRAEKKDSAKKDTTTAVIIDADHIMERIEQVGPSFGSQYMVDVSFKAGKTTVLFLSNHDQGKMALWKTVLEPFEANKTEKIQGAEGGGGSVVSVGDKFFALMNGTIYKLNLDANKVDAIATSYTFRRDMAGEFKQMFYEAWARLEENYYDEHFHGLDWKATRDRYAVWLPAVNNRGDLRVLLNDMLGELNSSHQGFYSNGKEEEVPYSARTMETGIVWDDKDPYLVKGIIRRSAADKAGISIKAGDRLLTVDGVRVDPAMDRNYYFTKPSMDRELILGFSNDKLVNIHPQGSIGGNLYDEWIDNNRERVRAASNGRIAYTCMKDMGTNELEHFITDMTQELNGKDGLILDIRYNTGGNVHDEVLRFLEQRSYLQWKYRGGKLTEQSNFAPSDKPIILLTNEQSLSDAEMTSAGFKALKLGKIVGNETYHWIIFTTGTGLVDGSFVRLPSWGCYTLEGGDLELNGVSPDIRVLNTFEDKINGRDPQLDRAIQEILKK